MHGKETNLCHFLLPLLKTVRMVGGHKVRHLDLTRSKEGGFGNLCEEGQSLLLIGHHMCLACNPLCDFFEVKSFGYFIGNIGQCHKKTCCMN